MSDKPFSQEDFNKLVDKWAVETLGGIGVYAGAHPEFDKYKQKVIGQLREAYTDRAIEKFLNPKESRKMEAPDGFARITGPCGDTMEFYLKIEDGKLADVSFQTDGCNPSLAAGGITAELAKGLSLDDAAEFSQQFILDSLGGLPEENEHCALLSVNTLKEAIKNYNDSL